VSRRPPLRLALFTIGLLSLPLQVLLLRELSVAFYGVELVYLLGLGAWLAWTAVGSLLGRRATGTAAPSLTPVIVLLGLLGPASLVVLRLARRLLLGLPGADLPIERGLLLLAFGLLPVGVALGLAFRRAALRAQAEGASLAECYAIESAGAVVGGALTTLALAAGLDALSLALASGAFALGLAALVAEAGGTRRLAGLGALAGVGLLPFAPGLDQRLTRALHPDLVLSRDSPYARISVLRRGEQAVLLVDDATAHDTEGVAAEMLVHPALVQARPGRVLILGGCVEGLVAEALRHAPEEVTCVELDPVLLALGRGFLGPEAARALGDPRVQLTLTDPRSFLAGSGAFDAILVGMPGPESGQANRFYTREFFRLCAGRLAPGGVLALRVRAGESYWAPLLARRMASVASALAAVFPDTLLLPGDPSVLLATNGRLLRDPETLAARLRGRGVAARLTRPEYLLYAYDPARLAEVDARLRSAHAPANTDDRPAAYGHAAALWLSRFFPRLAFGEGLPFAERPWALAAAPVVALLLTRPLLRRSDPARRLVRMAVAGFAGMALESVLLLRFQSVRGALFQDLGLLITAFMAGLAAGSGIACRVGTTARPRAGAGLLLSLSALSLLLAFELRAGLGGGLPTTAAGLALAGALVGGLLAETSAAGFARKEQAIALYAADLAGACLGSLLASLLLIPVLGLAATALATAALCLAGAAFSR
jgi:spermidine synthase